jgi:hypothetical protein
VGGGRRGALGAENTEAAPIPAASPHAPVALTRPLPLSDPPLQPPSFTAEEVIGYIRICRPGSVIGPQQNFIKEIQAFMWREGDAWRAARGASARPPLAWGPAAPGRAAAMQAVSVEGLMLGKPAPALRGAPARHPMFTVSVDATGAGSAGSSIDADAGTPPAGGKAAKAGAGGAGGSLQGLLHALGGSQFASLLGRPGAAAAAAAASGQAAAAAPRGGAARAVRQVTAAASAAPEAKELAAWRVPPAGQDAGERRARARGWRPRGGAGRDGTLLLQRRALAAARLNLTHPPPRLPRSPPPPTHPPNLQPAASPPAAARSPTSSACSHPTASPASCRSPRCSRPARRRRSPPRRRAPSRARAAERARAGRGRAQRRRGAPTAATAAGRRRAGPRLATCTCKAPPTQHDPPQTHQMPLTPS